MMKSKKHVTAVLVLFTAIAVIALSASTVAADPGVFPDKIIVGSPGDQSGPTAFATKAGIGAAKAYFAKAYEEKIYPRQIVIVQEDGNYSPAMHIKAAKLLIDKHKIFCFFLTSGTAATLALNTILEQEKIPAVGVYTHASSSAGLF
ncbi:ABC transporter substrate-binding protein [Thermodesulfobacteriota bacterium]